LQVQILKRKGALLDGSIALPSIPGTLASVLTPRLLRPSVLIAKAEASNVHALGSAVNRRRSRQLAAH
jgi:protein ImuA